MPNERTTTQKGYGAHHQAESGAVGEGCRGRRWGLWSLRAVGSEPGTAVGSLAPVR